MKSLTIFPNLGKRFFVGPMLLLVPLAVLPPSALAQGGTLWPLITTAIASHPSVQAQQSLAAAAEAGVESAHWQFFPTPFVSLQAASASKADLSYAGDQQVTVFGATQPLWTWGRLTAGLDKAKAQATMAAAGQAETQQQLAIRVVQNYGDWWAAYRRRCAYEQGVTQHQKLRSQVQRRVEEGQAAASDLTLAEGRLSSMQADLSSTRAQERAGLARLSQLTGMPMESALLAKNPAEPWALTLSIPVLQQQAEDASPTLARLRGQVQVEAAVIEEAKAKTLPEIQARVEQQHGNFSLAETKSPLTRGFITISSQFGAGLSTLTAVAEATHRHEAALAELEAQRRNLSEQIMTDQASLMESAERRQALQKAVALAAQVQESWDRQYFSGRKTWQDLMNSVREFVQTQAQLADIDATQVVASWRLAFLTGNISPSTKDPSP